MFRVAAEEIVLFMLQHKWLNQAKREIYEYAMEVILLNGGLLLINLIFSAIFHQMQFFVAFLLVFVPIRIYLGGLHLRSAECCMIFSVTFYLLLMLANHMLYIKYGSIELIIMTLFSLICLVLKPLPERIEGKKSHNKSIANIIIVADLLLIIYCWQVDFVLTSAIVLLDISALSLYMLAKFKVWMEIYDN